MDIRKYRLDHGLQVKEVVAIIKKQYPKYSKITHSMVENPHKYGVKLLPEAEALLLESPETARKRGRHRNKYRLSCRVTKSRYEAVKQAIEEDGRFTSVQAFLDWWVYVYLKKRAAPGGNDTGDGTKEN